MVTYGDRTSKPTPSLIATNEAIALPNQPYLSLRRSKRSHFQTTTMKNP
ncbi:MAG: hypothetical protein HC903_25060 [Methylacidiphilales bacterium]|nr:hypothetical protein [Candidatus Methylacidiphilales bacterium]